MNSLNKNVEPEIKVIDHILANDLKTGEEIILAFIPAMELRLTYKGNNKFETTTSSASDVIVGDLITVKEATLHYPLFIDRLARDGQEKGKLIVGDISGITSIQRLKVTKPKK